MEMEEDNSGGQEQIEVGSWVKFQFGEQQCYGTVVFAYDPGDIEEGQRMHLGARTDEFGVLHVFDAELVYSPSEWIRRKFPRFCDDIAWGRIEDVKLTWTDVTDYEEEYGGISFRLNDEMAVGLGRAIQNSDSARNLELNRWEMEELSIDGVDELARGIASSRSLQYLCMNAAKLQVDIVSRRLRESRAIKRLQLYMCSLPGQDAFRELCESRTIDHLQINHCYESDNAFEKELYKFLGLKTIDFSSSCPFIKACLDGLVEHPTLDRVIINYPSAMSPVHQQLLSSFQRFLESRERKASMLSLVLQNRSAIDVNLFLDVIGQSDALKELDLSKASVDAYGAEKIQMFLRSSKHLHTLDLPHDQQYRQYESDGLKNMLLEVQKNTCLTRLSIATVEPETLFAMLKGNTALRTLKLYGYDEDDSDQDFDLEGLKNLHGLQHLDISLFLEQSARSIDLQSLVNALKVSSSLEDIAWGRSYILRARMAGISSYLNLNRWFNMHSPAIMQSPERFSQGLWPHIFGKVSSNVNALHSLVRGNPGIVEKGQRNQPVRRTRRQRAGAARKKRNSADQTVESRRGKEGPTTRAQRRRRNAAQKKI